MSQNRPVPGIARGPQGFSPRNLPPISNPMGQPPMQDPPAADVVSIVDELAMEIYVRLASELITTNMEAHRETLQLLGRHARAAAAAYFEGQTNG